jgi:hypothetical protein
MCLYSFVIVLLLFSCAFASFQSLALPKDSHVLQHFISFLLRFHSVLDISISSLVLSSFSHVCNVRESFVVVLGSLRFMASMLVGIIAGSHPWSLASRAAQFRAPSGYTLPSLVSSGAAC